MTTPQISRATRRERGQRAVGRGVVCALAVLVPLAWGERLAAATSPVYEHVLSLSESLSAPTAVAVDAADYIYVIESTKGTLLVYDASGVLQRMLSDLRQPISVAVDASGQVLVGNGTAGNVEVYGPDLTLRRRLGAGDGEFGKPGGIALDGAGLIYVADSTRDRVAVYNPDGTFRSTFGGPGTTDGLFHFPTGIAIDRVAGEIIVSDLHIVSTSYGPTAGARIQVFDLLGGFKRGFGTFGFGLDKLTRPIGVAVDAAQRIYVTDAYQNGIEVFDASGVILRVIADGGHPVRTPLGVAVGSGTRVVVASLQTGRVEVYGAVPGVSCVTVTPGAGTDDGFARSSWSASWKPAVAGSAMRAGTTATAPAHLYQSVQYRLAVGLLRFDTGAAVPDGAPIWSATLAMYVSDYIGSRTLVAEYYPAGNWPIDASDWSNTPVSDAHAGTSINQLLRNRYNTFPLQNVAAISTTGATGLRLHLAESAAPTSDASVTWVTKDGGTNVPRLEVCYGEAGAPTPTSTVTAGGTATPTPLPSATPTATLTSVPTATPTSVPTATLTSVPTVTLTSVPTVTPSNTPTPVPSRTSTTTPTPVPTPTGLTCVSVMSAAGADDGLVRSSFSVTWKPPSGTGVVTNGTTITAPVHLYQSGQYRLAVGLVRFDTGAVLPDGVAVSSATLKLFVADYLGDRTLVAQYYPASSWPIDVSDWSATAVSDAHAGTAINTLMRNQYNALALQNVGNISTTGPTGFRLHLAEDAAPASDQSVTWSAREALSNQPILEVCYGGGTPATVTASSTPGAATVTPTPIPTVTPTATLTANPTNTPVVTSTPVPTATMTPGPSVATPTGTPAATKTPTPVATGVTCVNITSSAGADDGLVRSSFSVSWKPPSGTGVVTNGTAITAPVHLYQSGQYRLAVGLARFDTGAVLPDGVAVSSATLKLFVADYLGDRTLVAEYYPASNWPIDVSDWSATAGSDAHAGTAINTLGRNQYNALVLQNVGNISTTGPTGFRLHLAENAAPASDQSVTWSARESLSNQPILEVCYGGGASGAAARGAVAETPAGCGDGVVEAGELCDDGNSVAGDGCDATCQLEPCGPIPALGCRAPMVSGKALLAMHDASDDTRDRIEWTWRKGATTTRAEFGDQQAGDAYSLCVYDNGALVSAVALPAGGTCAGRPCWTVRDKSVQYRATGSTGALRLKLREGFGYGQSKIRFTGKGGKIQVPDLRQLRGPLTVQLVRSGSEACWEAVYSAPFRSKKGAALVDTAD